MNKITFSLPILLSILLISACSSSSDIEQDKKPRPDWIDHAQTTYPSNVYLTAVGQASSRTLAGKNAVANLVEIFSVNVKAETHTLTEAIKNESALGVTMESSSSLQRNIATKTNQAIAGVEIKETWLSQSGEYYALAVLHKISAAQNLTETIMEADQEALKLIDYSQNTAPNSILAVNALRNARDLQVSRKMADLQLAYIRGRGIPNEVSSQDIEQLIRNNLASLEVSVAEDSETDISLLQAGLSTLGVKVVDTSALQLSSSIDVTKPTRLEQWYWLRGSYELSFSENGKVMSRKRWPIKVSAQQPELLQLRLRDKLNENINTYLQQLLSDSPTL